ncbi:MAG: TRAP transporter large permease subunit, partial [Deltaproteobacteria bacterium]|nr:TRAP transporter large permease subunit [Deltaproteobacteria bacterium]
MYILLIVIISALSLCGAPIFIIIGALALWLFYSAGIDSSAVIIELYRLTSAPTLAAIPFFTFAGYLLAESKAPERFVALYKACFGWMPGGLVIVTIIASAFFTAFTGASGVTIIALGGLLMPILLKEGYSEKFSLGLITCCGSVGLLFPPSLPIILYGLVAGVSIDQMFLAGIVPGVVLITMLSVFGIMKNSSMNWLKMSRCKADRRGATQAYLEGTSRSDRGGQR